MHIMLDYGADPNLKNCKGESLEQAYPREGKAMVKALADYRKAHPITASKLLPKKSPPIWIERLFNYLFSLKHPMVPAMMAAPFIFMFSKIFHQFGALCRS